MGKYLDIVRPIIRCVDLHNNKTKADIHQFSVKNTKLTMSTLPESCAKSEKREIRPTETDLSSLNSLFAQSQRIKKITQRMKSPAVRFVYEIVEWAKVHCPNRYREFCAVGSDGKPYVKLLNRLCPIVLARCELFGSDLIVPNSFKADVEQATGLGFEDWMRR